MIRVTEILEEGGVVDSTWFSGSSANRGIEVHCMCALDDAGTLDEFMVDDELAGYLKSWRLLKNHLELEILEIEREVVHEPFQYVGHLDRIVRFNGSNDIVVDIKSGGALPWHSLQCALYAMAWAQVTKSKTPERGCVYLKKNGSMASITMFCDPEDFIVAKAAITIANWKRKNRL